MSLEILQERLAALQETTAQLGRMIEGLKGARSAEECAELAAEIGTLLRGGMEEQQEMFEEARYIRQSRLRDELETMGAQLSSCRRDLRRARLCARQTLDRAQREEREQLLSSFTDPVFTNSTAFSHDAQSETKQGEEERRNEEEKHKGGMSEKERAEVGASSTLTDALHRTHALMTSELTRSEFAQQMLAESSEALGRLDESYGSLDGMLASSRDLLGTLLRSRKSDTWYLQTARAALLATLAWLVFRRILYGPLWWLVWLPLRVGVKVGSSLVSTTTGQQEAYVHDIAVPEETYINNDTMPPPEGKNGNDTEQEGGNDTQEESMMDRVGRIIDGDDDGDDVQRQDSRSRDEL